MGSTFRFIAWMGGVPILATLVGKVVRAAVCNLPVAVFLVGGVAFARHPLHAGRVVQIGVELAALNIARCLLDIGARPGMLPFELFVTLMWESAGRATRRIRWAGLWLAKYGIDTFIGTFGTARCRVALVGAADNGTSMRIHGALLRTN